MTPNIATAIYVALIMGLFWLDRDSKAHTSKALWIPVIWMSVVFSRTVGQWLQMGTPMDSATAVMEGSPVDRAFYTGLLIIGIIILIGRKKQVGQILRANGPIILFFCYCLASLLWSDFPDIAFKRWNKAVGDLVMVLIVLSDRNPLAAIQRLLVRTSYVLIPLSVLFIKYYPGLGVSYGPWGGGAVYVGVATSKNTLGVICLCFGLAAVWRAMSAYEDRKLVGRTRHLAAQAIILVLIFWLLKVTNAMTSIMSFAMASSLMVASTMRWVRRRPAVIHLMIATMLAVSISVVFLGASPAMLKTMGRDPTLTDRTEIWGAVLNLVHNPLLGTGFESFWLGPRLDKIWTMYWFHPQQAHNGYLEIYLNLGWVGIFLLGFVIVSGYRTVFRAWRANVANGGIRLAYFFVGLVFNFTEAAFFRIQAPAWMFLMFAIVGVPLAAYRKSETPAKVLVRPPAEVPAEPVPYQWAAGQG